MKKRYFFNAIVLVSTLLLISFGCTGDTRDDSVQARIVVFAAASLTDAMDDLISNFEADHPGVHIVLNLASSHQLAQQLVHGAPADVFASANQQQMDVVQNDGRINIEDQTIFAQNRLVVIYSRDSKLSITELDDIAKPDLKIIIAAPDVTVGRYSLEFLDRAAQDAILGPSYREAVLENIVSFEVNVKFVLTKVALGEADAGIVYVTDVYGERGTNVGVIGIPDHLNPIAEYPIAILNDSTQNQLAQSFIKFVTSQEGRDILSADGFTFPNNTE